MNRGLAKRAMFESRADVRAFLSGVARAVHRGEIEVHAWCVLTTHFHMLVRSPRGELSRAMRRIQNGYVRHFNRQRKRDGSLVRGRFCSKRVDSMRYREVLVRYIDANPVRAGLCRRPADYAWCSARQYSQGRGPRWLSRDWVEGWVADLAYLSGADPRRYPDAPDAVAVERMHDFVERRLVPRRERDDFDSLVRWDSSMIRAWLRRRAKLADGKAFTLPCLDAFAITDGIRRMAAGEVEPPMPFPVGMRHWQELHAGLLRDLARASLAYCAQALGVSTSQARRLWERHRRLLLDHPKYSDGASFAVRRMMDDSLQAWGVVPVGPCGPLLSWHRACAE